MPEQQSRSRIRKFLPLVILAAGLALFFILGLDEYLSFAWLASHYSEIKSMATENLVLALSAFFILYTVAVAFSLPIASPLTLIGGAIFGWLGFGAVVTSATLGAYILFIAARGALAESLSRKAGPFMSRINAGFNKSPFYWLLALRLIPALPFWAVNIAPALLGMKTRDYILATAIGIAPGSFVYIWIGRGFDSILARGETPDLSVLTELSIIAPFFALGVLALVPVGVEHLRSRRRNHGAS